jgi:hypothetical protein
VKRLNRYYMLVSSLPALPPRLDGGRQLISIERLQDRLRMLEADDASEMGRLLQVFRWMRQVAETNDTAVVKRYSELIQEITYPMVREVVSFGMNVRMIMTALRQRRRGLGPPLIGTGDWFGHIRRHFDAPEFGLGHVFPWIAEFDRLLQQGKLMELHKLVSEIRWVHWKRRSDEYYFSFEAVVLYVARWDILREHQHLQAERGRARFETLVTEVLNSYAN